MRNAASVQTVALLTHEFSGWSVWLDDCGGWWATRRDGPLSDAQISAGLATTVTADTADELRSPLQLQMANSRCRQEVRS